MSVTIETIVSCDGAFPCCDGHDWSADMRSETAAAQRRFARDELGWRMWKGKDYCASCFEVLRSKDRKKPKPPTPPHDQS